MRIVATLPGRFGDILWAMPTVRALQLGKAAFPTAEKAQKWCRSQGYPDTPCLDTPHIKQFA